MEALDFTKEIMATFYRHLGKVKQIKPIGVSLSSYEGECFFIETNSGEKYVLKFSKNFEKQQELEYLGRVVKEAQQQGFKEIPGIIPTDDERAGIIGPTGKSFILYEFKKGEIAGGFDYKKMGKFLAGFHNALRAFTAKDPRAERKKIINVKKQVKLLNWVLKNKKIDSENYNSILRHLKCLPGNFSGKNRGLKKGIIHGDFNARNVLKLDGKFTGLVDLDDLHQELRVLDFSRAILHNPTIDNLINFVKEYQKRAAEKLTKDEIRFLPEMWRYRLVKMLIWSINSPSSKTVRKIKAKEKIKFEKAAKKDFVIWLKTLKKFDDFAWNNFYKKTGGKQ